MASTETSLALTAYQKQAIVEVAAESMIPQSILARAALLKAVRNDPFLRLAAELVAKGWKESDLDISQFVDVLQIVIPAEILETYGILAKLMGIPKVTLYRQAIFEYGPEGIQDALRESLSQSIRNTAGMSFVGAVNSLLQSSATNPLRSYGDLIERIVTGRTHLNGAA